LWRFGAIVPFVFISVFLAITLIGIPLIPLLSLSTVVASLVGSLGVALFVGQLITNDGKRSVLQQFSIGRYFELATAKVKVIDTIAR
jgi:hypothetical protein